VFENENKISSVAYTVSCFGIRPYVLLSFGETLEDMYIMIHELGHAVHDIYMQENQPLATCYSSVFVDEVISTLNELLLTDYLLKSTDNPLERIELLAGAIDNMEYYFSSALRSDLIYQAYTCIEQGKPFTAEFLDSVFVAAYGDYYGGSVSLPNTSGWAKYGVLNYYDYQYTTSIAASTRIYLH